MIEQIDKGSEKVENLFTNEEEFYRYGDVLVNMTSVMQNASEERIKSEKMKVDLITNVSHDLQTPLTAIIADVENLIREKNKDIRLILSTEETKFLADSAFMYRVIQNLLINAISYSLDHTRIFCIYNEILR